MSNPFDTIVAPITGSGTGPVALIRVSGPESWRIAAGVFSPLPEKPEARRAYYGHFSDGDDGLALFFEEGASYTGEQSVELSCHGSRPAVRSVVELCIQHGARQAEPGEFTLRAFMNGRLDLTEAEGVRDTVEALTSAQLRFANMQRGGALRLEVSTLRDEALRLLAAVEASVDFEEEIGALDRGAFAEDLRSLAGRVESLLQTAELGRIMRRGIRVAIVGPPNAGKSSLLNALLGSERAIVTEHPGTTRDFVEEQIEVAGLPIVLIDTAGLRSTCDPVEAIGVQRARAQAAGADIVWYVYDASVGFGPSDADAAASLGVDAIVVANKVDLAPASNGHLCVSAKTGAGLGHLVATVTEGSNRATSLDLPPINDRHAEHLCEAKQALAEALQTLEHGRPDDMLAVCLQTVVRSLGQITGETATADMVEKLFSSFCIGK